MECEFRPQRMRQSGWNASGMPASSGIGINRNHEIFNTRPAGTFATKVNLKPLGLVIGLLLISVSFIQCTGIELVRRVKQNPDRLYWSETRMLSWDDFQGTPPSNPSDIASEIKIWQPSFVGKKNLFSKIQVSVECYMDKRSSWVDRTRATNALLYYNQVVFDIYELYARRLRRALLTSGLDAGNAAEIFTRLTAENDQLMQRRLKQYQTESDLGQNLEVTRDWFRQIRAEIRELAAYR